MDMKALISRDDKIAVLLETEDEANAFISYLERHCREYVKLWSGSLRRAFWEVHGSSTCCSLVFASTDRLIYGPSRDFKSFRKVRLSDISDFKYDDTPNSDEEFEFLMA